VRRHATGRVSSQLLAAPKQRFVNCTALGRVLQHYLKQSRGSQCGICGGQSGTEEGFSPSNSVFL
jgi:hypothetical protein